MEVDSCNDAHVCLSPFAATVRDLIFEQLQGVKSKFGLWDLQGFLQDVGGFVLHKEKVAVSFVLAYLLHDA